MTSAVFLGWGFWSQGTLLMLTRGGAGGGEVGGRAWHGELSSGLRPARSYCLPQAAAFSACFTLPSAPPPPPGARQRTMPPPPALHFSPACSWLSNGARPGPAAHTWVCPFPLTWHPGAPSPFSLRPCALPLALQAVQGRHARGAGREVLVRREEPEGTSWSPAIYVWI